MELIIYLLKVSACLTLFFAFYLVVLRKLTFFKINRFYLLVSVLGSFVIPGLQFTIEREVEQIEVLQNPIAIHQEFLVPSDPPPLISGTPITYADTQPLDWYALLSYVYFIIAAILLVLAMWKLAQLLKYTDKNVQKINGLRIVEKTTGFTNCSFFNYVFVDKEQLTEAELSVLLRHESVHVKQLHSIDKMIMMMAKVLLWFNPIIYLYDKALEQIHEYEADEATSKDFGTNNYAALLLRLAVEKGQVPLVHNFVKSPIKARIKMLFNDKSKNLKKLAYILALPIGMMLIWGFTIDIIDVLPTQGTQEKQFTLVLDAGHGGKHAGSQLKGFAEKDITISMAKKIKAIAEARGIKVLLTRSNDEYVAVEDRTKLSGTVFLSLHVNSAPSNLKHGVEMFISAKDDIKDIKYARSNSLTYYLYQSLKSAQGIKIDHTPKKQDFVVLNSVPMPAVLLELGYLSNKDDFKYITNSRKQDELAKLIVDGVINYQQKMPTDEEQRTFQKSYDEFNIKYTAWKKSEKYKSLIAETKKFKAQTVVGSIQSLNYLQRGKTSDVDGFIVSANKKLYRIYLTKEQLKDLDFKVGDRISFFAPHTEVWFDSDYPVIKPKKVTITPIVSVIPAKINPVLLSSLSLTADNKTNIFYIKKGRMQIGEHLLLEAEDMAWDKNNEVITAQRATLQEKNGNRISGESLVFNLRTNSYQIQKSVGNVSQVKSAVFEMIDKLPYHASDSVKISKTENTITLYGKASISFDGKTLKGDKIEINKYSNVVTAYNGELIGLDNEAVRADVISYNTVTKRGSIKGFHRDTSRYWDRKF